MSKKNLAKRIIALVAIVAMFAAMTVTVSAASYSSTTMYAGNGTVEVTTSVSGLTKGDEVTYYAKSTAGDVYVNQYTATGTSLEETYKTTVDTTGLEIKMAKVDEAFDNYEEIKGTNANKYSFIMDNKVVYSSDVAPAADDIIATSIPAVSAEGKAISSLKATYNGSEYDVPVFVTGATVSVVNPVTFADVTYIELTAEYGYDYDEQSYGFEYAGTYSAANYTVEDVTGNLIAVLYKATVPSDAKEIGIEIRKENGVDLETAEKFAALGVLGSEEPQFAIGMVTEGLESMTFAPYYIKSDDTVVYGSVKTANFSVADAE